MPTTIESWVLDGLSLTSGTFTLMELNADPPRQRQDWISAADSEDALLVRQPLHENRKITMKLRVASQASMNAALDQVGALVDKLRAASASPSGISLVWTPTDSARTATFTVLAGEIVGMPIATSGEGISWIRNRPILDVEFTCRPYWVGTETLTSTASSSTPFVTLEVAGVTGDVPALGRLIVTDTATQSRRHVEWGLEGPLTYNASTSLLIDSDSMVTSGFAGTQNTVGGAYDPNATGNNAVTVTTLLQPVAVCGTGNQSHVGSFRVKARVTGTIGMQVRLSWRAGDGPMTSNAWAELSSTQWLELDLGTVISPAAVVGSQRWTGQIEAYHPTTTGGSLFVDYLLLIPTSDGYGKARAAYAYTPGVVNGFDQFTGTTAGSALGTRSAPAGGNWATSGSTTDFAFADSLTAGSPSDNIESINRQTIAVETTGRFAILGTTNYTDSQVDVRFMASGLGSYSESGLIARWTDASNHLRLRVPAGTGTGSTATVYVEQIIAGAVTVISSATYQWTWNTYYRFRLIAFATGHVIGQVITNNGIVLAEAEGSSTAIATGGTLASGEAGVWDRATNASVGAVRGFAAFSVSTPAAEPIAIYSGRNMQVRHDDVIRQDSTGTYTGRPPSYRGSRFMVPVGTSRVLVKARRNDVDAAADDQVADALQIQVGWTPRGLAVPR